MYSKLSGFSDEISENIITQFEVLNKLGIKYFEPRGVDGKNISALSDDELKSLKDNMRKFDIKASSIGSPIGKIKISDDFDAHFNLFKRVVEIAKFLDTKYIRMFSFYNDGKWDEVARKEVFRRLNILINYAKENDVILLHENEKDIYGDTVERCLELMKEFYCENFKAVFDPANFVQCNQDTKKAINLLSPYVEYLHIKDAISEDGRVVPSGFGDGNIALVVSEFLNKDINGFISLEPHLGSFEGLSDLELDDSMLNLPKSGEGTFTIAFNALNKIISGLGGYYE